MCWVDLGVGGEHHFADETGDGRACSFRGTYLEIDPPVRIVDVWLFERRPDADAVESANLRAADGEPTLRPQLDPEEAVPPAVRAEARSWES